MVGYQTRGVNELKVVLKNADTPDYTPSTKLSILSRSPTKILTNPLIPLLNDPIILLKKLSIPRDVDESSNIPIKPSCKEEINEIGEIDRLLRSERTILFIG